MRTNRGVSMSKFPQEPVDSFDICDLALRQYFTVLKPALPLIILLTLAQAFTFYLGHLFSSTILNVIFEVVGLILFLYFSGALLCQIQSILEDSEMTFQDALRAMISRLIPFFICLLLIIAVVVLYYWFISHVMQTWIGPSTGEHAAMKNLFIFLFLCLSPIVIFIVFMIFAPAVVVLDQLNPIRAYGRSYRLIGVRWLQAFTIYACVGIVYILVAPGTLHAHFFMHYHVFLVFVLFVYVILLPFVFNYILFMLNDFKLRLAAEVDLE
jgi:hypothetical protein